jgi:PKD repeat protein
LLYEPLSGPLHAPPVDGPPVAIAIADLISGDGPLTVNFDGSASHDTEGAIASHTWDYGDGTSSAGPAVQHVYMSPGVYVATLTVADSQGATDTDSVTITVSAGAVPTVCVGSIDLAIVASRRHRVGQATVTIIDDAGAAVPNATVTGVWSGKVTGGSTGVTNAAGQVVLTSRKTKKSGTITFTVTDVVAPGAIYDPGANAETAESASIN